MSKNCKEADPIKTRLTALAMKRGESSFQLDGC